MWIYVLFMIYFSAISWMQSSFLFKIPWCCLTETWLMLLWDMHVSLTWIIVGLTLWSLGDLNEILTGWETKFFWHSPELGSVLYSLYKIPLSQACFTLARPYFHSHWRAGERYIPSLFRQVIFKLILLIAGWGVSSKIAIRWMSLDLTVVWSQHWFR